MEYVVVFATWIVYEIEKFFINNDSLAQKSYCLYAGTTFWLTTRSA